MNIKALATAFFIGAVGFASSASAATVTVNGADFDVSIVTGTFSDLRSQLEGQIWWGNQILANEFAMETGLSAGEDPFFPGFGPSFAYDSFGSTVVSTYFFADLGTVENFEFADVFLQGFAVATPLSTVVPLPAGGFLLLSCLIGVAGLMRRKKCAL